MPVRVNLPPGCDSLKFSDGKEYYGKRGTSVVVDDRHARQIPKSRNGALDIVSNRQSLSLGTKAGRWCAACRFLAQAWSVECPRCGRETVPEA